MSNDKSIGMPNERSIRLFGRVTARAGEQEISDFTTVHARNLLVYLAMHPDVDHPRDRLVQAIWPGSVDGSSRNRLSVTLYHARRTLANAAPAYDTAFVTGRSTVRFDASVVVIDLHEFRKHIGAARRCSEDAIKRDHYMAAFDLYKGPLAPDIVTEWTLARQLEASQMFHEAAVWLALDLEAAGNMDYAQDLLSRALDTEPYSERATELMTDWHIRAGRFEEAAACAKRLRRALASHGQTPGRTMLVRIEELKGILADKVHAAVFANETVVTVLAMKGSQQDLFENVVREHGGLVSDDGRYGLFADPLMAMAAGNALISHSPGAKGLVHTTIMGENDAVPSIVPNGLAVMERRGLYGSEAFVSLIRERDAAKVKRVSGAGKMWTLT